MWQEKAHQIRAQLTVVNGQLKEKYGSQQKPKKKRNYALRKVYEPPSDNE
jgi:hypothetical protein